MSLIGYIFLREEYYIGQNFIYVFHVLQYIRFNSKSSFFVLFISLIFLKHFNLTVSIDNIQIMNEKNWY